jgi:hypothetical protein
LPSLTIPPDEIGRQKKPSCPLQMTEAELIFDEELVEEAIELLVLDVLVKRRISQDFKYVHKILGEGIHT